MGQLLGTAIQISSLQERNLSGRDSLAGNTSAQKDPASERKSAGSAVLSSNSEMDTPRRHCWPMLPSVLLLNCCHVGKDLTTHLLLEDNTDSPVLPVLPVRHLPARRSAVPSKSGIPRAENPLYVQTGAPLMIRSFAAGKQNGTPAIRDPSTAGNPVLELLITC